MNRRLASRSLLLALLLTTLSPSCKKLAPEPRRAGPPPAEQPAATPDEQPLPDAETVLDRYIEVTGGKAAYQQFHNRVLKGTLEFEGMGVQGPLALWQSAPANLYMEVEPAGLGTIKQGCDGETLWEMSMMGPRVLSGVERATVLRGAQFNAEIRWRELYPEVETLGLATVDGQECYEVKLTPTEGKPVHQFFDKQSGLLVKSSSIYETQMGEIPAETFVYDYKEFDGVMFPTRTVQTVATMRQVMTLDSIEHNVEIPADRFAVPAEVQGILAKDPAPQD